MVQACERSDLRRVQLSIYLGRLSEAMSARLRAKLEALSVDQQGQVAARVALLPLPEAGTDLLLLVDVGAV